MIVIPRNKQKDILIVGDILITPRDIHKEIYKPYTQGVPFVARDNQGDWIILQLKTDIHDTLSSYRLFTQNILSEYGIEEQFWIDFEDQNQELLFKLKYL